MKQESLRYQAWKLFELHCIKIFHFRWDYSVFPSYRC